ncbi:MAG: general secretion pathway protein GspK [Acidobacteriia bacterium]|nr:general secretion pathway protein GspK [Terriglobia bacterium]
MRITESNPAPLADGRNSNRSHDRKGVVFPKHHTSRRRRGSALLTVLWLSAALAAIAFSLANTVLGETDRTSTEVDGLRCYYLAAGAVHRAYMEQLWSVNMPPDKRRIPRDATAVDYVFPSGNVHVEIIPETAKLDVNAAPVQDLYRLGVALGIEPERAQEIAAAIDDWRRPTPAGGSFDAYYLSLAPSFRASHASIQEIEELLQVKGVTPDIFYGTYLPAPNLGAPSEPGAMRLVARPGLVDCLSVFGSRDRVDANTASPAVLAAVGLTPYAISALLQRRRIAPIPEEQLYGFVQSIGARADRLRLGGNSIVTMRATAQLRLATGRLSDLKRTVAAQVKFMQTGSDSPVHILRWYDTAWSN